MSEDAAAVRAVAPPASSTAATAPPLIEAVGLWRVFAGAVALADVSFRVARGEVVGLLGPNGAGKTTCMRILAGFLPPSGGVARVAGIDVARDSLGARRRLGYLPEGVPLYPELRVAEHLEFRARLKGVPRRARRAALDGVIERCGLGEVRRRLVGQLSRGYRQRLGLADALLADPPLLILDEPTTGLDPNQIREARELIRGLGGAQTVLLSTHILPEVEAVCSRVLVLHRGRLVAQEPVAALRRGGGGALLVQLRVGDGDAARAALAALAAVPGVSAVERIDDDGVAASATALRLRLRGATDDAARERVAAAIHAGGWALQQLHAEEASLEEVFARLTNDGPTTSRAAS